MVEAVATIKGRQASRILAQMLWPASKAMQDQLLDAAIMQAEDEEMHRI